jgi:uncharacterized membrane protein YfcA
MSIYAFIAVIFTGIAAGLTGALFGIGGGIILVPILAIGFELPMHQAVAASMIAVIATSTATASVYVDRGYSNIRLAMALEVMTTAGGIIGAVGANFMPADLLKKIFAVFLVCTGVLMWWRARSRGEGDVRDDPDARIRGEYFDPAEGRGISYAVRNLRFGVMVSFLAGNISGLLGVGGGIVKVPVMTMACGVPMKAAAATSNLMIGVTAVAGAIIYFAHGHVHPYYAAAAALGVLAGSRIGMAIGARLRGITIMLLFVLLLFATAARMFF